MHEIIFVFFLLAKSIGTSFPMSIKMINHFDFSLDLFLALV